MLTNVSKHFKSPGHTIQDFFLIYVNDIVVKIDSTVRLFADDTTLYLIVDDPHGAARQLNSDLEKKIHVWAERWLVKFNPTKSEALLLSRKTNKPLHPPLLMNNEPIHEVTSHKHLGSWGGEFNKFVELGV